MIEKIFNKNLEVRKVDIFTKAKELADAISGSQELATLKEAEMQMMMDTEARSIIEEYQTIQMDAMNNGMNFEDLPEEQKARVEELEGLMNDNANISAFLGANQAFEQILRSVNMIISSAINGGEQGGCSGCSSHSADGGCSCSGGCGSC